jgi:hypothetical protein
MVGCCIVQLYVADSVIRVIIMNLRGMHGVQTLRVSASPFSSTASTRGFQRRTDWCISKRDSTTDCSSSSLPHNRQPTVSYPSGTPFGKPLLPGNSAQVGAQHHHCVLMYSRHLSATQRSQDFEQNETAGLNNKHSALGRYCGCCWSDLLLFWTTTG